MGKSEDPRVQAELDRLNSLSLATGRVNLDTITALMERLGNPQDRLPPVFHVAGTNGKGSTCAFLRAMLEAQGYRVHVTTSPHLVRYNERIRIAGDLIDDSRLADALAEVFNAAEGLSPSFFEVTIAAAFLEFSRVPADACVIEVGLGGRLDATNILKPHVLAACGIAALGIDHERFLLAPEDRVPKEPMARIAFEKAGIAKTGVPLVTLNYPPEASREIVRKAKKATAPLVTRGDAWDCRANALLEYRDEMATIVLPRPALPGAHQIENAALAVAMLRHQNTVDVSPMAMSKGLKSAQWPARLHRLSPGPLVGTREVWLDGGHNPSAGAMLGAHFEGQDLHLIIGMLENKDATSLTGPLSECIDSLTVVPVTGHDAHVAEAFGSDARSAANLKDAMSALPDDDLPVLIAGSLYLAGEALRLNDEIPD